MNHTRVIAVFGIICLIAVAFAGCAGPAPVNPGVPTTPPTPAGTAVPAGHLVVTETQNTAIVRVNLSTIITVKLQENPTTGFVWNLTTTPGLRIVNDTYVPSEQKIMAVYKRSWEPTSGNETAFSLTIVVA
jgi:inhibitor of cysteine peptidase